MDAIQRICCNVDRALEAKGHIRSPEIVVDGLGQRYNVQAFLTQQVRCLMCAVAAENYQAVQLQLIIGLFHRRHFVDTVCAGLTDQLVRSTAAAKDCAALCQNTRKIVIRHQTELSVDQSLITVLKAIDFNVFRAVIKHLCHASHRCIQCLTVAAAGQHTYSLHPKVLLLCAAPSAAII